MRWSRRARTCTARTTTGTVARGCILVPFGSPQCRGGRSVHSGWSCGSACFRLCRTTALHLASQKGHAETALALAKAGADVHCKTNDGYGPRGVILGPVSLPRTRRTVHSARCCTIPGLRFRWTALHRASLNGRTQTAMALVKAGADVNCKDNVGSGSRAASLCRWFATVLRGVLVWLRRLTALHLASQKGHTEMAIALVKAGADVHCKATNGCGSRVASRRLVLCATGK